MRNKKAQTSETITWIVATIIIVLLLLFFIFGASMLGSTRVVEGKFKESLISKSFESNSDLFLKKSIIAYYNVGENYARGLERNLISLNNAGNFRGNFTLELNEIQNLI